MKNKMGTSRAINVIRGHRSEMPVSPVVFTVPERCYMEVKCNEGLTNIQVCLFRKCSMKALIEQSTESHTISNEQRWPTIKP